MSFDVTSGFQSYAAGAAALSDVGSYELLDESELVMCEGECAPDPDAAADTVVVEEDREPATFPSSPPSRMFGPHSSRLMDASPDALKLANTILTTQPRIPSAPSPAFASAVLYADGTTGAMDQGLADASMPIVYKMAGSSGSPEARRLLELIKEPGTIDSATASFESLLAGRMWEEAAEALRYANEKFNGDTQKCFESALTRFMESNPRVEVPSGVIVVAAACMGGVRITDETRHFKTLLNRHAWAEVAQALQHANEKFNGDAQKSFESALTGFMESNPRVEVPSDVIVAAACLGKTGIEDGTRHFLTLLGRYAWAEVAQVLQHANEKFNEKAQESFEAALTGFMQKNPGIEVPSSVILAAACLGKTGIEDATRHFKTLLNRHAWTEVAQALQHANKKFNEKAQRSFEAALTGFMEKNPGIEVPSSAIVAAACLGKVEIEDGTRHFRTLLERHAWTEVAQALQHANKIFYEKTQRWLDVDLTGFMEKNPGIEVPSSVILAAACLHSTILDVTRHFKTLLGRHAWAEVAQALQHANKKFNEKAQKSFEAALSEFMGAHPEIGGAPAFMDSVYPFSRHFDENVRTFALMIRGGDWKGAHALLSKNATSIAKDRVMSSLILAAIDAQVHDENDATPPAIIANSVKLGFVLSAGLERFDLLLERRAWPEVAGVLTDVRKRGNKEISQAVQNRLQQFMMQHADEEVPEDVLVAAFRLDQNCDTAYVFFDALAHRGAWKGMRSVLKDHEDADAMSLHSLIEQIGSGSRIPADIIQDALAASVSTRYDRALGELMINRSEWDVIRVLLKRDEAESVARTIIYQNRGFRGPLIPDDILAMARSVPGSQAA